MKAHIHKFCFKFAARFAGTVRVGLFKKVAAGGAVLASLALTNARADTNVWTGNAGDSNWSTANNWNDLATGTSLVPGPNDSAYFFDSFYPTANVDPAFGGIISGLLFGSTNTDYTLNLQETLNITGTNGLTMATLDDPGTAIARTATVIGSGVSLNLDNADANLVVSQGTASEGGSNPLLDLSGLDTFNANVNRIGLGVASSSLPPNPGDRNAVGSLALAKTNFITVNYAQPLNAYLTDGGTTAGLEMSYNPGNPGDMISWLYLGRSNVFHIDSISVGRSKSSVYGSHNAPGVIEFDPIQLNAVGNTLYARFRGLGGPSSRVTWWSIGDMGANGSSSQTAVGTNDFTGGTVDAMVDTMSLGRDSSGSQTGTGSGRMNKGVLIVSNGVFNVNTMYVGNQSLGSSANLTPNVGIVDLTSAGASLIVNDTLHLGYTTQNSQSALTTTGIVNVAGGSLMANTITVGAASADDEINLSGGATLIVSNTIASSAKWLSTLSSTDSTTLQFNVSSNSSILSALAYVTNLVTGSGGVTINVGSAPVFSSYPKQVALIRYDPSSGIQGSGYNFTLGSVPPTVIGGFLSNDTVNSSVDLVLASSPAPTIALANQPQSQAVHPGTTVTFTVTPDGATPFTYQWRKDDIDLTNQGNISGATTASLTVTSAQTADQGDYSVVVSNAYGSVTSVVAVLTVSSTDVAPSISQQPQDVDVVVDHTATLTVTASGLPVPSYQWLKGTTPLNDGATGSGSSISGSTSGTLTIQNAQPTDAGSYSVIVSNSVSSVQSDSATLTVYVAPTITVQPADTSVLNGQNTSLTVTATDTGTLHYQWQKGGLNMPGATNATLPFSPATPSDAGTYNAVVSNPAGSVVSSNATLLVNSPMSVVSLSPANGATGVCFDTPLRITFDRPPVLGDSGRIIIYTLDGTPVDTNDMSLGATQPRGIAGTVYVTYPVMISGDTATIYPHLGVMTSNQTYYVTIENTASGVFQDTNGATFTGISGNSTWSFTTKTAVDPTRTNFVVAADGSGDFATVQGVIDFIRDNSLVGPTFVNIRNGVYTEINNIPSGENNITFRGESRDGAIITYPNNNNLQAPIGAHTYNRIMFYAGGDNLVFENLTLTNSTPQGGSQAEALRVQGSYIIVDNVNLASYQDTVLINSSGQSMLYANKSRIKGQTDFIWGSGVGFFQNCEILAVGGGYNTQPRNPAGQYGFIFNDCLVDGTPGASGQYLGRDAGASYSYGNVAYLNCRMSSVIDPAGWSYNGCDTNTIRLWEYHSTDLTGTSLIDVSQRAPWSKQLSSPTDPDNGNDLTDPSVVFASTGLPWTPQLAPYIASQPVDQNAVFGQTVTIAAAVGGIPEPTYQWMTNGVAIPGATSSTLIIPNVQASNAGTYSLQVTSPLGNLTSSNAVLTVGTAVPPAVSGISRLSDGNVRFSFSGGAGQSYRIWASTNLALTPISGTWTLMGSGTFGNGASTFTDNNATNYPQRFYVISVP